MPSLPEIGSSLPEVVLRTAIVYLFVVTARDRDTPQSAHPYRLVSTAAVRS